MIHHRTQVPQEGKFSSEEENELVKEYYSEQPCKKQRLSDSESDGFNGTSSELTEADILSILSDFDRRRHQDDSDDDDSISDHEKDYGNLSDDSDYFSDKEAEWLKPGYKIGKKLMVYYIWAKDSCLDDSACIKLLKEIGCESEFIRRSRKIPTLFWAKLRKRQAKNLEGVIGIAHLYGQNEHATHG